MLHKAVLGQFSCHLGLLHRVLQHIQLRSLKIFRRSWTALVIFYHVQLNWA